MAETLNCSDKEKKIYAREFHLIKDNETILAYDIENIRLIELNELELSVLDKTTERPASISELKKRLPPGKAGKVEEAVNQLISVNMLDYNPFKKISRERIDDFERKRLEKLKNSNLRQICLNVTHRCNLHCDYCYGGDGSYGGPARHMSRNTAEQAVDFLMRASGDSEKCRITFFGGEPLLNVDLVKHIVRYSRKEASRLNKKIFFGITTNGVLLDDDNSDFLIKEKIEVTFSFDGPKKIQDKNRPFKSNKKKSSYDVIYPKILTFIEKAEKNKSFYGFRATITRPGLLNMDEVEDFFNCFKTKKVYYDTAEYKDGKSPGGAAIGEDDLRVYRQKVKDMADDCRKNKQKSKYKSLFSGPLKLIREKTRKKNSCISPGSLYAAISPEGDIFPCHRFVGYKETKLGNIWEGFDREKWLEKYVKVNIFNSKRCSTCWIRYFCGGMCPATNYFLGGDLLLSETVDWEPVHCTMKKIVFEEAMLLYSHLSEQAFGAKGENPLKESNAVRN
jgi:uncharacterized protein